MSGSGPSELGVVMRPGAMIRRPQKPVTRESSPLQAQMLGTKIYLRGLTVVAQMGVYDHEKGHTRPLIVDVEVWVNPSTRPHEDELSHTIDYDTLATHIRDVAGGEHLHLLETFAEHVCARILTDTRIDKVRLKVEKPGSVADAICSGVEIERMR